MDECDHGRIMADRYMKAALDRQRSRIPGGVSKTHCQDCGESIPQARRKAVPGCTRCVECESELERNVL